MTTKKTLRWVQRFSNFQSALRQLESAIKLGQSRPYSDLEKQGLIQAFEFTHELGWNVLKDYFEYQGTTSIAGSRDASREAFQKGLITDGEIWMNMIKSRNQSTHTYNKSTAEEIVEKIQSDYFAAFVDLQKKMNGLLDSAE